MREGLAEPDIAQINHRQPVDLSDRLAVHIHQDRAFGDEIPDPLFDQAGAIAFFLDRPLHMRGGDDAPPALRAQ